MRLATRRHTAANAVTYACNLRLKTPKEAGEVFNSPCPTGNGLRLVRLHGAGNAVWSKRAAFVGVLAYGLKNGNAPFDALRDPFGPLLVGVTTRKALAGASPRATEVV